MTNFPVFERTDRDGYYGTGITRIVSFRNAPVESAKVENCVAVERGEWKQIGTVSAPEGSELSEIMGGEFALFIPGRDMGISAAEAIEGGFTRLGIGFAEC